MLFRATDFRTTMAFATVLYKIRDVCGPDCALTIWFSPRRPRPSSLYTFCPPENLGATTWFGVATLYAEGSPNLSASRQPFPNRRLQSKSVVSTDSTIIPWRLDFRADAPDSLVRHVIPNELRVHLHHRRGKSITNVHTTPRRKLPPYFVRWCSFAQPSWRWMRHCLGTCSGKNA